ncbi:unnamed protein product [Nesidiocoris tenuis]|uniref:Uncharacterized protein n=1 Tax=Nesidiocoris tenuis TaxID=355587 RepID=A0A6H5GPS4_9HEMI|nr:unnamed protein product [Nesidiocoris tenuis]
MNPRAPPGPSPTPRPPRPRRLPPTSSGGIGRPRGGGTCARTSTADFSPARHLRPRPSLILSLTVPRCDYCYRPTTIDRSQGNRKRSCTARYMFWIQEHNLARGPKIVRRDPLPPHSSYLPFGQCMRSRPKMRNAVGGEFEKILETSGELITSGGSRANGRNRFSISEVLREKPKLGDSLVQLMKYWSGFEYC